MTRNEKIANSYENGMTLKQCASAYGLSVGAIRNALKRMNVTPRGRDYRTKESSGRLLKKEKPVNKSYYFTEEIKEKEYQNLWSIVDLARNACDKLGGFAMIDDRYVIIDTNKYMVKI